MRKLSKKSEAAENTVLSFSGYCNCSYACDCTRFCGSSSTARENAGRGRQAAVKSSTSSK